MDEDFVKTREAGCDGHIAKPVKRAILFGAIRKYAAHPASVIGADASLSQA